MVVRPESPVNVAQEDELFREYMWMNDSEKFDEEYLEELFHQDPRIPPPSHASPTTPHDSTPHDSTPREGESSFNNSNSGFNNGELEELLNEGLSRVVEELEKEPAPAEPASPVEATPEILTKSNLNPDAQEFVPSSPPSR